MKQFAILIFGVLFYLTVLGLPVARMLSRSLGDGSKAGLYSLAPILGLSTYILLNNYLSFLYRFSSNTITVIICVYAVFSILLIWRNYPIHDEWPYIFKGVLFSCLVALITFLTNSADFIGISADQYFPVTNGDTFSYLSHVDQYRLYGCNSPILEYPAGYLPIIGGFGGRDAVVAFIASIAEATKTETHTAFFIAQRMALILISVGISGILFFLTSNIWSAFVGMLFSAIGNLFLHQILQQFSSCSFGSVLTLFLILVLCIDKAEKIQGRRKTWSPLSGLAAGVIFIVSPESGCLILVAVGFWFILDHAYNRILCAFTSGIRFLFGFIVGAGPKLLGALMFVIGQARNSSGPHPGDWIANSTILIQASGQGFTTSTDWSSVPLIKQIIIAITLLLYLIAIINIIPHLCKMRTSTKQAATFESILVFALTGMAMCIAAYSFHKGYALLKVIDYFSVVQPIILGIGLFFFIETKIYKKNCAIFSALIAILLGFYLFTAFSEKQKILNKYNSVIKKVPSLKDLKLDTKKIVWSIITPDLKDSCLDLFLYLNRFGKQALAFKSTSSNRYCPKVEAQNNPIFVRISANGYLDKIFADITHKKPWPKGLYFIECYNTLQITEGHWVSPDGNEQKLNRWLSVQGDFSMWERDDLIPRQIKMKIEAGPDLAPENIIQILVNGCMQKTINSMDLPYSLELEIYKLKAGENRCSIVVLGPTKGIRQLRISEMAVN
jgi:hypothetical protein